MHDNRAIICSEAIFIAIKGIIKEDEMDSFNVPCYTPTSSEIELEVEKEGSFTINHLEAFETSWEAAYDEQRFNDSKEYQIAQFVRAVSEPFLVSHFGEALMDTLFLCCQHILSDRLSKGNLVHDSLSISLTKIN